METEGYGNSDENEIILDGKDNKIKEDEKSVMENEMDQVPVMENISVTKKGRGSGHSNGRPECDGKRRGSDHCNGKSDCDRKICF